MLFMNILICSDFFNYYKEIKNEIEKNTGEKTIWYSDRPTTNNIGKAILRVCPILMKSKIKKHMADIYDCVKNNNISRIVIIFGETFTSSFIDEIKKISPHTEIIYYAWDCIKTHPFQLELLRKADKSFTFDEIDAKKYSIAFLPLFYSSSFSVSDTNEDIKFTYSYIGTIQSGKYGKLKSIIEQFGDKKGFVWPYFQSKLVYFYKKIKYKDLKKSKTRDFKYKKLSFNEISKIYDESFCVIDIPTEGSTGLTMRFFEALGKKKKIITTSKEATKFDFYRKENIYIFEGKIDFEDVFFKSRYQQLPENIYKKYSINEWTKKLMFNKEEI